MINGNSNLLICILALSHRTILLCFDPFHACRLHLQTAQKSHSTDYVSKLIPIENGMGNNCVAAGNVVQPIDFAQTNMDGDEDYSKIVNFKL